MDPAAEHRVLHLLQLAAQRLKTVTDQSAVEAGGLTTAQAAALFVIARGGVQQRDLARSLRVRESAVTAMVNRLCDSGLAVRSVDPVDQRVRRLRLTPQGEQALASFRAPLNGLNARITTAIGGPQQVAHFAAMLKALIAEFDRPPA